MARNITVEALEVPSICTISSPPVSNEIVRAMADQGQVAADARLAPTFRENQVSVLIGSDAYWTVATVNASRMSPTLMAVETVLGWTVQGYSTRQLKPFDRSLERALLFLGESSTEDAAVDNDPIVHVPPGSQRNWGTTEKLHVQRPRRPTVRASGSQKKTTGIGVAPQRRAKKRRRQPSVLPKVETDF
ncbi:hypothetical protein HPB48_016719 [Haemaphysalis longicornis]|uniref:Peptidase aspartic putative domain-containing protein n=1 Tax=Haemaphysalis longicornis TaxID=44386 RepID=A0A9J6G3W4_HAELO|nr:hypothetical protein HPB48_016719 [Haemaphysalis longicornis]